MKIVEFKAPLTMAIDGKQIKIKPKRMYLFADVIQMSFKKRLVEIISDTNGKLQDKDITFLIDRIVKYEDNIDDKLKKFNFKELKKEQSLLNTVKTKKKSNKKTKTQKLPIFPIILRTGGIGDLIALSSISHYIPKLLNKSSNLKFVSQEKYRDIFAQFKTPVNFVSYFSPVVAYPSNNKLDKNRINKKYRPIYFEGVIENSKENWFNLQYSTIGRDDFDEEQGRPKLKTTRISKKESNINLSKPSILMNCRSTAIIRSMRFQDFYEAVIKVIGDMDVNIYIHKRNVRKIDQDYIDQLSDERVNVIDAKSLADFFLDVYDATLSISVDTAQFHFREGIEKPAIGMYGPFPYECRTKFYKYTKSLNVKSNCPNMPCYIHVKTPEAICDFQQKLMDDNVYDDEQRDIAPCCCQEQNGTVQDQIVDNFKDYILDSLTT